jgi:tight adherence protein B
MPPGTFLITILLVIVGLFIGLAIFLFMRGMSQDDTEERLQYYTAVPDLLPKYEGRRNTRLSRVRLRLNAMLSALNSEELNLQLMSANWPLTASEYVLIQIGSTLGTLLLIWLITRSIVPAVGFAVLVYLAPSILLKQGINRRRSLFERQLVDVLVLLNGAVRSGFSLLQAMEVVVREMKEPASEEFKRVLLEVGLGLPLNQALLNLSARMENTDLNLLVTAVNIQHQVGGNLSVMMEAVTETIRERIRLFAEVRVLTTQQRYTGYLLSLLPAFVGAFMFIVNPRYTGVLLRRDMLCYPIAAIIGILLGQVAIRRMVNIEV